MKTYKNIVLIFINSLYPANAFLFNVPKKTSNSVSTIFSSKLGSTDFLNNLSKAVPRASTYDTSIDDSLLSRMRVPPTEDKINAGILEDRLASIKTNRSPAYISQEEKFEYVENRPSLPNQIFKKKAPITIQGDSSLKTFTFNSAAVKAVHIAIKTEGRPLDADIELWKGPENTPTKMRIYVEDGSERPFSCMIATPRGPNTIALNNVGPLEFPFDASVVADTPDIIVPSTDMRGYSSRPMIIQGGALRTYPFEPMVQSVQLLLNTDGRPLNARIELLQGPNNIKQVVELYTDDGLERPFLMVLETPGFGNVVRVVNTATMEFPLNAVVEAYSINSEYSEIEPIVGGDDMNANYLPSRRH